MSERLCGVDAEYDEMVSFGTTRIATDVVVIQIENSKVRERFAN